MEGTHEVTLVHTTALINTETTLAGRPSAPARQWRRVPLRLNRLGLASLLSLFLVSSGIAQTQADYLIVERPKHLVIYNRFQQQLTQEAKAKLPPFVPFKVVRESDVLGDGFTPCMRMELDGETYFFLLEEGKLAGVDLAGFTQVCNQAMEIGDTIEILRDAGLTLQNAPRNSQSSIQKRSRLRRIFRHSGHTYVRQLDGPGAYGWPALPATGEGTIWRTIKNVVAERADEFPKAATEVNRCVAEVNGKLARLFEHFNRKTSSRRAPPQWRTEVSTREIVCLMETNQSPAMSGESSQQLGKNIETALMGTGLRITASPGRIVIR